MEIKKRLDDQQIHWNDMLGRNKEMFGDQASYSGIRAAEIFKENGVETILELGAGQGRDTFYFLDQGFKVHILDYSQEGINDIESKARSLGLEDKLSYQLADLRYGLDLEANSFDACYSHMLYCMAFTKKELASLSLEVQRVLKPGGVQVYTSRNTTDSDYGKGDHLGDNLYVDGGFIIHYIDDEMIELFSQGFEIIGNEVFEEGGLPRILTMVSQRKI